MRIEPPPSPAVANDTRPAATAAALPPLDPPGVRERSHGLRVTPHVIDSVNGCIPNSGSVVFPSGIAPAARRIRTTSESCEATRVVAPVPNEVTSPARSCSSLTPNGIPSNGRVSPASSDCCAWSASRNAASVRTDTNAFNAGLRRSIRSKCNETRSCARSEPSANIARWRRTPANARSSCTIATLAEWLPVTVDTETHTTAPGAIAFPAVEQPPVGAPTRTERVAPWRFAERATPWLSNAIAGGAGALGALGMIAFGIDLYPDNGHGVGWAGLALCVVLIAAGLALVVALPTLLESAGIAMIAIGVLGAMAFVQLPRVHGVDDLRPFFAVTIIAWLLGFALGPARARPLLLSLALLMALTWATVEVADTNTASRLPFAAPFTVDSGSSIGASPTFTTNPDGSIDPDSFPPSTDFTFGETAGAQLRRDRRSFGSRSASSTSAASRSSTRAAAGALRLRRCSPASSPWSTR